LLKGFNINMEQEAYEVLRLCQGLFNPHLQTEKTKMEA